MSLWKNYYIAHSISEALRALLATTGSARPIAGGTDLLLELQQGRHPPVDTMVDVTAIPEMNVIEIREEELFVGAAVPLKCILQSSIVNEQGLALVEACGLIGGPQVRNSATLGGNVAHALPAADGTIALLALNAEAEIATLSSSRRVPLENLFLGPGRSSLDAHLDILVGFHIPLRRLGQASAFRRIMRPQGVALPILNMAVWLHRQDDIVKDIRLALGPAGPKPRRANATEEVFKGHPFNNTTLDQAYDTVVAEVQFRTSPQRASASYRRKLCRVLLEDCVSIAWERASTEY